MVDDALRAIAITESGRVVDPDGATAVGTARVAIEHRIAMEDII